MPPFRRPGRLLPASAQGSDALLRAPRQGSASTAVTHLEEIVRSQFRILRPLLERQVRRWVGEAQRDSTREAMLRTYAELRPLLDALDAPAAASSEAASNA